MIGQTQLDQLAIALKKIRGAMVCLSDVGFEPTTQYRDQNLSLAP